MITKSNKKENYKRSRIQSHVINANAYTTDGAEERNALHLHKLSYAKTFAKIIVVAKNNYIRKRIVLFESEVALLKVFGFVKWYTLNEWFNA